eukprot:NODE_88_length_21789_cov_0.534440.p19 type:complete len:114 gc:universal NODE_88_length_21789_cov_0.534440:19436-19095(-)
MTDLIYLRSIDGHKFWSIVFELFQNNIDFLIKFDCVVVRNIFFRFYIMVDIAAGIHVDKTAIICFFYSLPNTFTFPPFLLQRALAFVIKSLIKFRIEKMVIDDAMLLGMKSCH